MSAGTREEIRLTDEDTAILYRLRHGYTVIPALYVSHRRDAGVSLACMQDREALDAAEAAFTHDDETTGGRPVRSYRRLHQGYMAFREMAL